MLTSQMENMAGMMARMQSSIDRLAPSEGTNNTDTGQQRELVTPPPRSSTQLSPIPEVPTPQATPAAQNPPPFPPNLGRLTPAQLPVPPRTEAVRHKSVSESNAQTTEVLAAQTTFVQRTNPSTQPQYYQTPNPSASTSHTQTLPQNPSTTQLQQSTHDPPYTQPTHHYHPPHNHQITSYTTHHPQFNPQGNLLKFEVTKFKHANT
jgi:hypothetical protein